MELMVISFSYDGRMLTSTAQVESRAAITGVLPSLFKRYTVVLTGEPEQEIAARISDRLSGLAVDICTELDRWALEQQNGQEEQPELLEDQEMGRTEEQDLPF